MAFLIIILLITIIGGSIILFMNRNNGSDKVFLCSQKSILDTKKSLKLILTKQKSFWKIIKNLFEDEDSKDIKNVIEKHKASNKLNSDIHILAGDEDTSSTL